MEVVIEAVFCRQDEHRHREQLLMHCVCSIMVLGSSFCQVLAQTFLPSDELDQGSESSEKKSKTNFFFFFLLGYLSAKACALILFP